MKCEGEEVECAETEKREIVEIEEVEGEGGGEGEVRRGRSGGE